MTGPVETVLVPDIGDFGEVPIIEILVAPGDTVAVEDPLITLESDKATMDVPAPVAGVVTALKVKIGDRVSQGVELMTIEATNGSDPAAVADEDPAQAPADASPSPPASAPAPTSPGASAGPLAPAPPPRPSTDAPTSSGPSAPREDRSTPVHPHDAWPASLMSHWTR